MPQNLIKTIAEIGLERLDRCSTHACQRFLPAVRACFRVDQRRQPEAFGTCFLLRFMGRPFLVTAAHVVDNHISSSIYVASGESLALIEGIFHSTVKPEGDRLRDRYDFAFTELSERQCESLAADVFIDESMLSKNRAASSRRAYMTLGFPASKQSVVWNRPIVRTEPWVYVGFHRDRSMVASKLNLSGEDHFFIKHDKRVKTFQGREQDGVKPNGASGGILIDLGPLDPELLRPGSPCIGLLAGLIIEHHKDGKAIVAVKIQKVVEQMQIVLQVRT